MQDKINPSHYRKGKVKVVCPECGRAFMARFELIEALESWGVDRSGHLMQAAQYIFRAFHKGEPREDIEKAKWYLERFLLLLRGGGEDAGQP